MNFEIDDFVYLSCLSSIALSQNYGWIYPCAKQYKTSHDELTACLMPEQT